MQRVGTGGATPSRLAADWALRCPAAYGWLYLAYICLYLAHVDHTTQSYDRRVKERGNAGRWRIRTAAQCCRWSRAHPDGAASNMLKG